MDSLIIDMYLMMMDSQNYCSEHYYLSTFMTI